MSDAAALTKHRCEQHHRASRMGEAFSCDKVQAYLNQRSRPGCVKPFVAEPVLDRRANEQVERYRETPDESSDEIGERPWSEPDGERKPYEAMDGGLGATADTRNE